MARVGPEGFRKGLLVTRTEELLIAHRAALRRELEQTERALSAIAVRTRPQVRSNGKSTIQALALEVLGEAGRPLTADEIIVAIGKKGRPVVRSSLAPQLSRLCRDGKIAHAGKQWSSITVKDEDRIPE